MIQVYQFNSIFLTVIFIINYYDRVGFLFDNTNQLLFPNITMNNINIYNNDNSRLLKTSALFGTYMINYSKFIMSNINIYQPTDVITIIEENSVNNNDGRLVLNELNFYNFTIYENI